MTTSTALSRVLHGSVDLHCHSGPSPFPRRVDHAEAAEDAARLEMRAILVKSHHHSTVTDVLSMKGRLEHLKTSVFGGIALNSQVGGINPAAVAMSLQMGGRAVWFPTFSAGQHIHCHPEENGFPTSALDLPAEEVSINGPDGELKPEVGQVLDMIAEADAMVTGGHLDPEGVRQVLAEGKKRGVKRMLVNHPNFVVGADFDQAREYVRLGAYVEHSLAMYHPDSVGFGWDPKILLEWIDVVGPERTVLASDLGQRQNPLPVDGFLKVGELLLDLGVSEADLRRMTVDNPTFLLGLSD
jgi:hypothetical protein